MHNDANVSDSAQPFLILMAGMPGTGKSTIAKTIGRELNIIVIDKDVIISAMLHSNVPEEIGQPAAYRVMFDLGSDLLNRQRQSVILDSPAGLPVSVESARQICQPSQIPMITVLCSTDRNTRNTRRAARESMISQRDGLSRTIGNARERFLHLPEDTIEIDTTPPLETLVPNVLQAIRSRLAEILDTQT